MIHKGSGKKAIIGQNIELTYDQLYENIFAYSSLLETREPGSKICIFSENRPEWIYALYATWQQSCIPVPMDYLSAEDDLRFMVQHAKPSVIFCSASRKQTVINVLKDINIEVEIIVFDEIRNIFPPKKETLREVGSEETALILYTSGTTGNPKGVMLSFKNLIFNIKSVSEKVKVYKPTDRVLMLLPVHHIFPLIGTVILPLYVGCTIILAPSMVAEELVETMKRFKPTILIGVPRFYETIHRNAMKKIKSSLVIKSLFSMAKKLGNKPLSKFIFKKIQDRFGGKIRYLVSGGAKLEPYIFEDFKTWGFEMLEGYGLTETAPLITFNRPGKARGGTPGQPVPGIEIKIMDGEITVKGDNVMQGYLNEPGETNESIKDGRFYTGDLGHFDKDGYLHITGRKKEIIVLPNGKNINPLELENKLYKMDPAVKEVGVFMHQNILQTLIYPDFDSLQEKGMDQVQHHFKWKLIDRFNQSVSSHKKIMKFHISRTELPKTRLGKVKRYELPAMLEEKNEKKPGIQEPGWEEYKLIKDFLQQETDQPVHPDDHLEMDLALDSLSKVSLSSFISSTFGVEIKEEEIAKYQSVLELSKYTREHKTRMKVEKFDWGTLLKDIKEVALPKTWFTIRFFTSLSRWFFLIFYRVETHGKQNIPSGSFILAPNHQSFLDGFLVISQMPRTYRNKVYAYATVKYFKNKRWRYIANRNNIIVMDIDKNLKSSMQKLSEVLKENKNLLIFPEGARSISGKLGNFKQTFAILSSELEVPVVPVAVKGAYEAYPPGKIFPKLFKKLEVHFKPPVYPGSKSYESLKDSVYREIEEVVG